MMIMPANNASGICHYFAGKYPGKIGMLYTPFSYRVPAYYMPYAIDNGCFTRWDEGEFYTLMKKVGLLKDKPLFVCVPDVVVDAEATNKLWYEHHNNIKFKKAFVVQDGHEPKDVPKEASAVFVGGSTEWKLNNGHKFKGITNWLHIGRVNTESRLLWAEEIGADSVDGTGFFRGKGKQYYDFINYFEGSKQTSWI